MGDAISSRRLQQQALQPVGDRLAIDKRTDRQKESTIA